MKVPSVHVVSNRFKKSKHSFEIWVTKERDKPKIICTISEIPFV